MKLGEVGQEGLSAFYGYVSEAYIDELQWPDCYETYNEMRRRDPSLRSALNFFGVLARDAQWKAEPASDKPADVDAAEFLQSCLDDMSVTVPDFVDDALSFLWAGWSSFEICYKRRQGQKGKHRSQFTDGRIGWQKLAYRRQSSMSKWMFDDTGGMAGWVQRVEPSFAEIELPIEKLLHFTSQRDGSNPEGVCLLESAYEPWHFVKNLQIIGGIGWSRGFVGLPVFEFEEKPSSTDQAVVKEVGQGLTVDERQYVSVPPKVKFRLESTNNSGASGLLDYIKYFRTMMLQIFMTEFFQLGSTETGSWALASDKSNLAIMALNGYLDRIEEIWNRFGVARLFEYNEFPGITALPRIAHTQVRKPDLAGLGSFLSQISAYITLGDEDEAWIRQQAGMPEIERGDGGQERPKEEPETPEPETGTEEEELAEFAAGDGRDAERAEIEATLAKDIGKALKEQLARLLKLVGIGRDNPADDDAFWEAEKETFKQKLLGSWLKHIRILAQLVVDDAAEALGSGADWTLINTAAVEWAQKFVGREINGITETTRKAVRRLVSSWAESGEPLPALQKALTPAFGEQRAQLIASTEVTRAYSEANDNTWQSMGLPKQKMKPPAHPRCRCYGRPELLPGGEWVIVWSTVRDERVCQQPIQAPWGRVNGCKELHGKIVSEGDHLGEDFSKVRMKLRVENG